MSEQHDTVTEIWRPITGHPGYEVSNFGRVKSLDRYGLGRFQNRLFVGRLLKLNRSGKIGHLQAQFAYGKNESVHRLVLIAFVGPCPDGMECAHKDGNPGNNHINNLAWKTHKENEADKKTHGTWMHGNRHPQSVVTAEQAIEAHRRCAAGEPRIRVAESMGVTATVVEFIARGTTWKHLGLKPIPCGSGNYKRFTKPGIRYGGRPRKIKS